MGLDVRIQLCGQLVIACDGARLDAALPRRQGRLLFAFVIGNLERAVSRDEISDALWGEAIPVGVDASLSVLVSKTRAAIRPLELDGRSHLRLVLPSAASVDVEAAVDALHRAESALARGD